MAAIQCDPPEPFAIGSCLLPHTGSSSDYRINRPLPNLPGIQITQRYLRDLKLVAGSCEPGKARPRIQRWDRHGITPCSVHLYAKIRNVAIMPALASVKLRNLLIPNLSTRKTKS